MAVIVGEVKRNPDTGTNAKLIRTVVHTITVSGTPYPHYSQVIVIGDPDAANSGNLLSVGADGRAKVESRPTEATSFRIQVTQVSTTEALVVSADAARLELRCRVGGGGPIWFGPTGATSMGPYWIGDEFVIRSWRGSLYAISTQASTIAVGEFLL